MLEAISPKLIHRFYRILTKISAVFLAETKVDLKIPMEMFGTQNSQNDLQKSKVKGLTLLISEHTTQ